MGLFPVYRLEEADSLLKEGGGWGSAGALRACSYKTHPKPKLHLLSEGLQPLQGDKQEINTFSSEEVHRPVVYFH